MTRPIQTAPTLHESVGHYGRLASLDVWRFIAALAIVGFHSLDFPHAGMSLWLHAAQEILLLWAVPFFFGASGFLHGRASDSGSRAWLKRRIVRLGVPYLFWTTLRLPDLERIDLWSVVRQYLFCVPTSTLWFLWVLLVVTVIVWLAQKAGISERWLLGAGLAAALVQAVVTQLWSSGAIFGEMPLAALQHTYASPLLWLWVYAAGLAFARSDAPLAGLRTRAATWVPFLVAVLPVLARYGILAAEAVRPLTYHYAVGLSGIWQGVFGLAVLMPVVQSRALSTRLTFELGRMALGVYLVHPALRRLLVDPSIVPALGRLFAGGHNGLALWVVLAVLSTAVVAVALRIPFVRRVVG